MRGVWGGVSVAQRHARCSAPGQVRGVPEGGPRLGPVDGPRVASPSARERAGAGAPSLATEMATWIQPARGRGGGAGHGVGPRASPRPSSKSPSPRLAHGLHPRGPFGRSDRHVCSGTQEPPECGVRTAKGCVGVRGGVGGRRADDGGDVQGVPIGVGSRGTPRGWRGVVGDGVEGVEAGSGNGEWKRDVGRTFGLWRTTFPST